MKKVLMDGGTFQATLDRLASEIVEHTRGVPGQLALVGVRTRGVPLSRRLAQGVEKGTGKLPALGILDITLYRDDLTAVASQPILRKTDLPFKVDDAFIVLVDDVLYSGRTVRAAITALIDFGRPRKIELLVMVDRGWRELPIQADYVGAKVATTRDQTVNVLVAEEDGVDRVDLVDKAGAT
jgi:pyrimidine operon attenuation protein/uracil phosphoribosyltransferase